MGSTNSGNWDIQQKKPVACWRVTTSGQHSSTSLRRTSRVKAGSEREETWESPAWKTCRRWKDLYP